MGTLSPPSLQMWQSSSKAESGRRAAVVLDAGPAVLCSAPQVPSAPQCTAGDNRLNRSGIDSTLFRKAKTCHTAVDSFEQERTLAKPMSRARSKAYPAA